MKLPSASPHITSLYTVRSLFLLKLVFPPELAITACIILRINISIPLASWMPVLFCTTSRHHVIQKIQKLYFTRARRPRLGVLDQIPGPHILYTHTTLVFQAARASSSSICRLIQQAANDSGLVMQRGMVPGSEHALRRSTSVHTPQEGINPSNYKKLILCFWHGIRQSSRFFPCCTGVSSILHLLLQCDNRPWADRLALCRGIRGMRDALNCCGCDACR
jgi:hypothetical protein